MELDEYEEKVCKVLGKKKGVDYQRVFVVEKFIPTMCPREECQNPFLENRT